MKDAGHRACVEAALRFEEGERVPVNNFALATAAYSAGETVQAARWDPKLSAKVSVDYSMKTLSDFVKPILDSQVPFLDLGMKVTFPENDYGRVPGHIVDTQEEIDNLTWGVVVASEPQPGSYYTQKDDNFVLLYYY